MRRCILLLWLLCLPVISLRAYETPDQSIPPPLGEHAWTAPGWVKVRATCFPGSGKSSCGLPLRCATSKQVGSAGVPYWIPEGSVIEIWFKSSHLVYLAVDHGKAVESRKAARRGKLDHSVPVIDFCATRQAWPDDINVRIYEYVASTPFRKLSREQQEQLMKYAGRFIQ